MCFGGGNLFGSAGGLVGGILGDVFFPEIGIPATIAGAAGGSFLGNVAGGEAPLPALESAAITGATAGVGSAALNAVGGFSGIGDALGFGSSAPATTGAIGGDFGGGGDISATPSLAGSSSAIAGGPTTSGPIASATVDAAPLSGSSSSSLSAPFTSTNGNAIGTLSGGGPSPLTPTTGAAGAGSGSSTIPGTAPNAGAGGGGGGSGGTGGSSVNYFGDQTNSDLPGAGLTSGDAGSAVGGGGAGSGNWLTRLFGSSGNDSSLGGKLLGYLGDNPQALLGGAVLGGEALFAPSTIPGAAPLRGEAAAFDQLGQVGANALTKGQLPTGAQAVLDQMRTAGQARIRSNYASLGLSGSTSESQALAQNDQQVEAQKYQIINQLVTQGVAALGSESNINTQLMQAEIAKDKALQDSIARFAASLAGGGLKSAAAA